MAAECEVVSCYAKIPETKFFCMEHWNRIPWNLKETICDLFVRGVSLGDQPKDIQRVMHEAAFFFTKK